MGSNVYSISLTSSTTSDLIYLLNPTVKYVWVIDHLPIEGLKWHYSTVQLNDKDILQNVRVRSNIFDLMIETEGFLNILPMFSEAGISLLQMEREVPDTLMNNKFPDLPQYLIENGFYSQYNLPHKGETAMFSCIDEKWIETVEMNEFIQPRIFE